MDESRKSEAEKSRRSRRWLWMSLGGLVLLAVTAIPAWRCYWHTEYRRNLQAIGGNSRDSYHEPPPWSVLTALPDSLVPVVSRLRTVDLRPHPKRPLTAVDLQRLNQLVRYRQFGLGIERLCLTDAPDDIWDGLSGYQDLLYLKLDRCELPADLGSRVARLHALNVLSVFADGLHIPRSARDRDWLRLPPEELRELGNRIKAWEKSQERAIDTLWEAPQLEELYLHLPRPFSLAGHDFRRLRELHHLRLCVVFPSEEVLLLAELPALRTLDLEDLVIEDLWLDEETLAAWPAQFAELRRRRPDVDLALPRLPSENELLEKQQRATGDSKEDVLRRFRKQAPQHAAPAENSSSKAVVE